MTAATAIADAAVIVEMNFDDEPFNLIAINTLNYTKYMAES